MLRKNAQHHILSPQLIRDMTMSDLHVIVQCIDKSILPEGQTQSPTAQHHRKTCPLSNLWTNPKMLHYFLNKLIRTAIYTAQNISLIQFVSLVWSLFNYGSKIAAVVSRGLVKLITSMQQLSVSDGTDGLGNIPVFLVRERINDFPHTQSTHLSQRNLSLKKNTRTFYRIRKCLYDRHIFTISNI